MTPAPAVNADDVQPAPLESEWAWKPRWVEIGLIVAFWSVIGLLTIAKQTFDPHSNSQGALRPGEGLFIFAEYAAWAILTPGLFWLSRRFSLENGGGIRYLLFYAILGVAVATLVDLFTHVAWNVLVADDGHRPVSITYVLSGFHFLAEFTLYLLVLAVGFARDYFLRYRERLEESVRLRTQAVELQAQLAEARLQALRMQVNPHFLFNTLHTIFTYLERDPRGVRRMIVRLSELLRYALEMRAEDEVPLQKELSFVEGYLEIQRIRFGDRLEVQQHIEPETLQALVPNLILQPLVENAIKHGVSALEDGGRIELRAWAADQRLHLSVRDNGPGPEVANGRGDGATGNGIGLRNTRERLKTLYGDDQHLEVTGAEDGGCTAHLSLPYHTHADFHTTVAAS